MSSAIFRITLLFSILWIIPGWSSPASAISSSHEEKNYQVYFGQSYRNFLPGSLMRLEVTFKNKVPGNLLVSQELAVVDSSGMKVWKTIINIDMTPEGVSVIPLLIPVPKIQGRFTLTLGRSCDISSGAIPSRIFNVLQPKKSARLAKILVFSPDSEVGLNAFLKTWGIKAPMFSWAQVLLCGKMSWQHFADGNPEITQLILRALKREMSVIFLDFNPSVLSGTVRKKVSLPFGLTVNFIPGESPELSFILKSAYPELVYNLQSGQVIRWNGDDGIIIPSTDLRFEGKGVKISAFASAGENSKRFPIVELKPLKGNGKLYISQLITEGRLDEPIQLSRLKHEILAYDPMAVQFLLNLISASVGDNLLK